MSPIGAQALGYLDTCFTFIFALEIGLKLFAFGWKAFWTDKWNIFDFVIVTISLVEAVTEFAVAVGAVDATFQSSGVFSVLRVLRVLRILRTFRLFSMFEDLSTLVQALNNIIQPCAWVIVMYLMVLYIYAIMVTVMFGQDSTVENFHEYEEWFGTVFRSMYTLFQIMTLESWSMGIVRPVWEQYWYAPLIFITYIVITTICIINLFAAIFVDGMDKAQKELKDKNKRRMAKVVENAADALREAFEKLDKDHDGYLTQEELVRGVSSDNEIKELFLQILGGQAGDDSFMMGEHDYETSAEHQQEAAIETLSKAFEILDIDDSGRILCEDFLDVALHMDEPAKKEDIYHTRLAVSHLLSGVHQQTEEVKQAALGFGTDSVCKARDKRLIEATIKAVMQVIPDKMNFDIRKVLASMEQKVVKGGSNEDAVSELTASIYQEILDKRYLAPES